MTKNLKKILIVDDSRLMRKMLSEELDNAGFQSFSVENSIDALVFLDDTEVSLIILDWELPDMNGPELFGEIKKSFEKKGKKAPHVVFFTGIDTLEKRNLVLEMGALDLIPKDHQIAQIILSIKNILHPEMKFDGSTILVVDDEKHILSFYENLLGIYGVNVLKAYSGQEAFEIFDREQKNIDLVIMDYYLSDSNGVDVIQKIRNEYGYKSPIILSTIEARNREFIISTLNAGATDYFEKPIIKEEFLARVSSYLSDISVHRTLKSTLDQILNINTIKNQFISLNCFEMTNLLENVYGYTDIMEETIENSEGKFYLKELRSQLEQFTTVVQDLGLMETNLFFRTANTDYVNIKKFFIEYCTPKIEKFRESKINFITNLKELDKEVITMIKKDSLILIFDELFKNIEQHGGENLTQITLNLKKLPSNMMEIVLKDDGDGDGKDFKIINEKLNSKKANVNTDDVREDLQIKNQSGLEKVKYTLTTNLSKISIRPVGITESGTLIVIHIPILAT